MTEKNQTLEGIQVHDVVVLHKLQRTNEDGSKRGYSFYAKGNVGLVSEVSPESMNLIYPDRSEEVYVPADEDKDYYYTIAKGSEIEYQNNIEKNIAKLVEERKKKDDEIKELMQWRHDFEHSISFIGKLIRFARSFNK